MKSPAEIIADLDKKYAQQRRLYDQLKVSLAIQKLWPDAFMYGPVDLQWCGSSSERMTLEIRQNCVWDIDGKITHGGEVQSINEVDVPDVIYCTLPPDRAMYLKSRNQYRRM